MQPTRRYLYSFGALLCVAALMAACGGASPTLGDAPGENPSPAGAEQTGIPTELAAPTAQPPPTEFTSPLPHEQSPLPTPADATEALVGRVPQDLLDAVFDDLLERLDVGREAIAVEQAGPVIWRDGSLGCPQKGMMYTQALVPGFQIVLMVGDETYDYHASERGHFVLCEGGLAPLTSPPAQVVEEVTMPTSPTVPTPSSPYLQELLTEAKEDLAERLGMPTEEIDLVELSPVVWPDGGLGCPEPGVAYTQVQQEGLLIRLRAGKRIYPYHSGGGTPPFLCQQAIEEENSQ